MYHMADPIIVSVSLTCTIAIVDLDDTYAVMIPCLVTTLRRFLCDHQKIYVYETATAPVWTTWTYLPLDLFHRYRWVANTKMNCNIEKILKFINAYKVKDLLWDPGNKTDPNLPSRADTLTTVANLIHGYIFWPFMFLYKLRYVWLGLIMFRIKWIPAICFMWIIVL